MVRRGRVGVVINLLFHNGAVDIVGAKAQRNLGDARREHDPVSLDVVEIIEQQARYGDGLEVGETGRLRQACARAQYFLDETPAE